MSEFMNNIFMNNIYVIKEYNKLVDLHNKMRKESDKLHSKIDKLEGKNHISERDQEKIDKLKVKYKAMMDKLKELSDAIDTIDRIEETIKDEKREMPNYIGTPDEADFKRRHKQNCDLYETYVNDVYEKYEDIIKKMRFKPTKKQFIIGGGVTLSAIALLLALRYGPEMVDKNKNSNQNPDGSNPSNSNGDNNNPSGSNQPNPDKEQNKVVIPELEQEELAEIIKVEDESLIPERAQDLLGYLNIIAPDHGLTLEEVTTYLNYKNGFVNNTTQEPTQNPVETPTTGTFTNIDDEKQVYERANQIVPYFTTLVPAQNMTVEQVEEFLNYFYGKVDDPNYDGAAFTIDSINDLMFAELGSSVDILNEVKTSRGPAPIFVDYTKFFIDGSQGQKLAEQITEYRSAMIAGAGSDITSLRKGFTELFMNSWILKGNNGKAINAYTLESAGERALIDLMFLNTAVLCGDSSELVITHPITGDEVTLEWILNQANYEACPTTLDDGTEITLDKSSQDLYSMYQQAVIRKNQDAVLGLNQK